MKRATGKLVSTYELLGALTLLVAFSAVSDHIPYGDLVEALLMSLVFFAATFAVRASRSSIILCTALAVPALISKWCYHFGRNEQFLICTWFFGLLVLLYVSGHCVKFLMQAKHVDKEVLCASLVTYLMFGFAWAFAYLLADHSSANAFSMNTALPANQEFTGHTALYFSFVTLSTVGYGDITPASNLARVLAILESNTGLLFMAVVIARMVALYSANPNSDTQT